MGSAVSSIKARKRFYTYGRDYFHHVALPACRDLLAEIEISQPDAAAIFDAFVAMDTDGSGQISVSEFHRYFEWKRGVFTERIFDTYSALKQDNQQTLMHSEEDDNLLSFEEFLVCVWNYATYDATLLASWLWSIFDIDSNEILSKGECDALVRLVWYTQQDEACDKARDTVREACDGATITREEFIELIVKDGSILQPAFDIQSRIAEKTTGNKKTANGRNCWDLYRERRLEKYGASDLPDITFNGKKISSWCARFEDIDNSNLSEAFISSLFRRVDRHLEAPEGFDSRLEEERLVDKLREKLFDVETVLSKKDFSIDLVEERKRLRKRLWSLVEEIKDAHIDALEAERDRDVGIYDRYLLNPDDDNEPLEFSSEDDLHEAFDGLIDSFTGSWKTFVDSYEERFGPPSTCWEKLYDANQQLSFYFQWQTGERCYDQQLGDQPPAICEVCDSLIALTDYKCFNCDAPRSERNKKKYRGRVSLESLDC